MACASWRWLSDMTNLPREGSERWNVCDGIVGAERSDRQDHRSLNARDLSRRNAPRVRMVRLRRRPCAGAAAECRGDSDALELRRDRTTAERDHRDEHADDRPRTQLEGAG